MPPETEHQRNERMMARWTRQVGIFTIVLATIAAVSAGIFYWQLQTMQAQLNEMEKVYGPIKDQAEAAKISAQSAADANRITRENFVADQRPWISLADVRMTTGMQYDSINKALKLAFQFIAKNNGRSPAHNVRIDAIMINIAYEGRDIVAEQRKFARSSCEKEAPFFSYPLFPGEVSNPPIGIQLSLNKDEIAASLGPPERKVIMPVLIGCVSYQFLGQKERHQTGFILTIGTETGYIPFDSTQESMSEIPLTTLRLRQHFTGWYAN